MAATCLSVPSMAMAADTSSSTNTNIEMTAGSVNYDAVKLTWDRIDNAGGYVIYMSENGSTWTQAAQISDEATTEYILTKLTTGKAMKFKVKAANSAAEATASATPTLRTTIVSGTASSSNSIKVTWNRVPGAQSYRVYKYNSKSKKYSKIKTTKKTSYTNKKLASGKKYTYIVRAMRTDQSIKTSTDSAAKTLATPKKLTWKTKGFKKTNAYKVMKVAKSKVGCAYVSGAAGPRSFDCSGYVAYVNNKAKVSGKKIKRSTAQSEWNQTKKYSIGRSYKNAQPGDIVFISSSGSKSNITHVAFYYGGNKLIHATNPSVGVAITNTAWSGGQSKVVDIVRLPNM
ncbi:MAG: NlpC/P60 family protein [Eubacteriaceae bacterium]|nr:NlpC/P60 family protein [Eubacteriaceae bacterium]